ncbi:MAG: LPS export ABC transporter periplasmic protein LptC [Pseudomonadota bacterium]
MRSAKRHSAVVRILRNLLPVLALLVLGAYFFSTRMNVHVGGIAASIDGLEITDGALRMLNPTMRGTDKKNGDYVIKADYADQDVENPNLVKLTAIKADVNNKSNGNWSRMRAVRGKFDSKKERLILKDKITLATSAGLTGELSYATIDMKKQILRSHNPVKLDLPTGTVRANAMTLYSDENTIVFRGKVAVRIEPQKGNVAASVQRPASAGVASQVAEPVVTDSIPAGAVQ